MNRRDLIRHITLGAMGVAASTTGAAGQTPTPPKTPKKRKTPAGRTPEEAARDAKLQAETFFTPQEMATLTILCDIILPADAQSGGAVQAGVPAFIEFIVKDMPQHQTPLRGGLMWLDNQSRKRFGRAFTSATPAERIALIDDIAYPELAKPAMGAGVAFFNLLRDLTMTGFYTTEMGFNDLGYVGNRPNIWQGVPKEVLAQYGLTGEE